MNRNTDRRFASRQCGTAMILVLVYLGVISLLTGTVLSLLTRGLERTSYEEKKTVAYSLAEAGIDHAIAGLRNSEQVPMNVAETRLGDGTFSYVTQPVTSSDTVHVTSVGTYPGHVRVRIEVDLTIHGNGTVHASNWSESDERA